MESEYNGLLIFIGLVCGITLGALIQRSRFCMTAIVSNYVLLRDVRQLHTYFIAVLFAISGVFFLESSGTVSIIDSSYRSADIHWFSVTLGGLIFGFGAVMAGGCIGRILTLTGEGNLGALLSLLAICLSATAVYTGLFEPLRVWAYQIGVIEMEDISLLSLLHLPSWLIAMVLAALCLKLFKIIHKNHMDINLVFTGIVLGLLVVVGWWVTGSLTADEFSMQQPTSLTFSGPLVNTSLYVTVGNEPKNIFGMMLVMGTLLGSFISALYSRQFRITPMNQDSFIRIFNGGLLMGIGATMAGGCNIGQGLSGLSTLSLESILAVICIFSGMYFGVKWLQFKMTNQSFLANIREYCKWGKTIHHF